MHIEFDINFWWLLWAIVYCIPIPFVSMITVFTFSDFVNLFNEKYEDIIYWILGILWPITLPISIIEVCVFYIIDLIKK